ncbi:MAG: hypothetical protein E6767_20520 [Dysgonomonas sp.]|nr:hypothetical protein [Dysgonomonas sp.]
MKRTRIFIILFTCIIVFVVLLFSKKWNADIYMESTPPIPYDKIDLKVLIDDTTIFDDTLERNPYNFPTHIVYPMRIGFHNISVSSKKVDFHKTERIFWLCNQHYAIYYLGISKPTNEPAFFMIKRSGFFSYE